MPYPREHLLDKEEVILELRPHWWYLVPRLLLLLVALVVGIAVLAKSSEDDAAGYWKVLAVIVGILVLGALVFFLLRLVRWFTTEFTLTTDRVVYRHGVLRKQGIETGLDRIDTVVFNQGFFERIIGAGDLVLEHAGDTENRFTDIRKPAVVQAEINRQIETYENRRADRIGGRVAGGGGGGGGGGSKADELQKLDELRRNGVLTEEEFQAQKAALLGG